MTSRQPGERFSVRLIFPFEDFERAGERVEIRVPGQSGLRYGQIERIERRVPPEALARPDDEPPSAARRLAEVLVRPDRPFALEDFGTLVTVRFP